MEESRFARRCYQYSVKGRMEREKANSEYNLGVKTNSM
jgi:hypothetical protein